MWPRTHELSTRLARPTHQALFWRVTKSHVPSVAATKVKVHARTSSPFYCTAASVTTSLSLELNSLHLRVERVHANPTRVIKPTPGFANSVRKVPLPHLMPPKWETPEGQMPRDMACGCKTKREKERRESEATAITKPRLGDPDTQDPPQDGQPTASFQSPSFHRRHLPNDCIAFSSLEGRKLFIEALNCSTNYMQIYFPLAEQFTTQTEPAFCGLATLAMCLNALQIDPGRLWKGPWRWFSEELFDCCTSLSVAREKGISLSEFLCLARCNGVATEAYRANSALTLEHFRDIVKHSCATSTEIVVLNYSRQGLGQTGEGHFSPIGGYHAANDLVLLLDVARFKYPPHWVKLARVYEAMQLMDPSIDLPRGLVILKEGAHATGLTRVKHQSTHCDEPIAGPSGGSCCFSSASIEAARHMADSSRTF